MIANPSEKTPFNSSDPENYQAPDNGWDHERARVREFSRTAEDTVRIKFSVYFKFILTHALEPGHPIIRSDVGHHFAGY
jgi:hypothetical protein